MTDHNRQKKIAAINDMSGFGRCSLAVELPLISRLGVQCCPVPTAIFSNHTGFPTFFMEDFTDQMTPYIAEWSKLGLRFDGILSGFLGSVRQIAIVEKFIDEFSDEDTVIVIDPVMGDNGRLYPTYTRELCDEMCQLARRAHILTPNLTEACILTDTPYREKFTERQLLHMAEELCGIGPDKVVLTGIPRGGYLENYCYERGKGPSVMRTKKTADNRSGTGDVFAAIVAAGAVRGIPFAKSVRTAANFIKNCLKRSAELGIPPTDGVCFEEVIEKLNFTS